MSEDLAKGYHRSIARQNTIHKVKLRRCNRINLRQVGPLSAHEPNGGWSHKPLSRSDRGKTLKKGQDLRTSPGTVECNLSIAGDAMNLKSVLGQIKADCCNMHMGGSFQAVCDNYKMANCHHKQALKVYRYQKVWKHQTPAR